MIERLYEPKLLQIGDVIEAFIKTYGTGEEARYYGRVSNTKPHQIWIDFAGTIGTVAVDYDSITSFYILNKSNAQIQKRISQRNKTQ